MGDAQKMIAIENCRYCSYREGGYCHVWHDSITAVQRSVDGRCSETNNIAYECGITSEKLKNKERSVYEC